MDLKFHCTFCSNSLVHDGLLLTTYLGPLVMCLGCRALYYLTSTVIEGEGVLITLIPSVIDEQDAYDIIRQSEHQNFGEFLKKATERKPTAEPERITDVREAIKSCTTPTDLIRKLDSL